MGGYHDHRPLFCQSPQHFYFTDNGNFIPQRVAAAKEGSEFFYPGAVEQSAKPKLDNFTGKTIGTGLKASGNLVGITEDNLPEDFYFFLVCFVRSPGTQLHEFIFDFGPKFILIGGIGTPTVSLHSVLLAVNGSFKFFDQPLA